VDQTVGKDVDQSAEEDMDKQQGRMWIRQ